MNDPSFHLQRVVFRVAIGKSVFSSEIGDLREASSSLPAIGDKGPPCQGNPGSDGFSQSEPLYGFEDADLQLSKNSFQACRLSHSGSRQTWTICVIHCSAYNRVKVDKAAGSFSATRGMVSVLLLYPPPDVDGCSVSCLRESVV